jgi:hypothetical protein
VRAVWITLVLAGGCEKAHDSLDTPDEAAKVVSLQMIDLGREPRIELRLHPKPGDKQTLHASMGIAVPGLKPRGLEMTYELRVIDVDGEQIHSRELVTELKQTAESDHEFGKDMIGGTIDSWRDSRGVYTKPMLKRMRYQGELASHPELQGAFPVEAVGVGAKWHEVIEQRGATASVDYELEAIDATRVRLRLDYTSDRPSAKMPSTARGTAHTEFDLNGLSLTLHMAEDMTVRRGSREITGHATSDVETVPSR